jgi:capsular exopolysaccharide synthesis family protein
MEALPGSVLVDSAPEVDLRRAWATIARSAWLILVCVLLAMTVGVVAVRRMQPVFQATASIRLDPRGASNPAAALYGITSDNTNLMATAVEVITSRSLAYDVVDSLGLRLVVDEPSRTPRSAIVAWAHVDSGAPMVSYRLVAGARGTIIVNDMATRQLASVPSNTPFHVPGVTFRIADAAAAAGAVLRVTSMEAALTMVRGHVAVMQPNVSANILNVTFEGNDPELVPEVSNVLASRFVRRRLEAEKAGARSTVRLLHKQLDTLGSEMRVREDAVSRFLKSNAIISVESEQAQKSAELEKLVDLRMSYAVDRQALMASLKQFESVKDPGETRQASERVLSTPAFLRAQGTYSPTTQYIDRLRKQEDALSDARRRLNPNDPDIKTLERQIISSKFDVASTVSNFIAGLGEQVKGIDERIALLRSSVALLPGQQVEYQRLTRGQKGVEDIMNQVEGRLKEAEILAAVQDSTAEVLDRAVAPAKSLGTSQPVIFGVALLFGLIMGVAVAFLRDWLDTTVHNEQDVSAITGVAVIGIIPNLRNDVLSSGYQSIVRGQFPALSAATGKPVRDGESQTMAAEAYRALRTNLSYVTPARPPRIIVITSALSGDGKTTSAANLAVTLAQQNKRVLLIDAETRRGNLHTLFGIEAQPGFFDLLYGQATPGECIRRVTLEGSGHLDVLPSGGAPNANAADLLVAARLAPFFDRLRSQYDFVLIDTPPLNLFTDAALIGAHADATLLVARADRTERQALRFAVLQLQHVQATLVGAVLNGVDLRRNSRYRGGYDFGRYGAYYS